MATNANIITRALRELNIINEVQSPSAEQTTQCLEKLNSLMEVWKEDSKDLGWFRQSDSTATAPVPDWAEEAVVMALAVTCASQYGASISQETAAKFDYFVGVLTRKLISENLGNTDMSHLPEGSGHWGNRYDIGTDI